MGRLAIEKSHSEAGDCILALDGRLDSESVALFDERVAALLAEEPRSVILQLADLEYISSAGLRSILKLKKELSEREAVLKLVDVQAPVRKVIDLMGIFDEMDIFSKDESADIYLDAVQRKEKYKDSDFPL